MRRMLIVIGLLGAAAGAPAAAKGQGNEWHHSQSGVSIAREIGEMRVSEERDLSGGEGVDVTVQLGVVGDPVTVYVYRSAYPNAALWFERTRLAMNVTVGAEGTAVEPRAFTLGAGATPNGLREELDLPAGAPATATAVAIAQHGEWLVKFRITSTTLDRAGVAAKMDRLLAAVRLPETGNIPTHPLLVPQTCADAEGGATGARIESSREMVQEAVAAGLAVLAESRGMLSMRGLAANPAAWCRPASEFPPQMVSLYRERDGNGWVLLLGDSGRAVAARNFEGTAGAGTYVVNTRGPILAAVYDSLPSPEVGLGHAGPILLGQSDGMMHIRTSQDPVAEERQR